MLKVSLDYATEQRSPTFTFLAQSFQVELAVMQGRAHEVYQWAEQAYASLRLAPMHTFYIPELTIPKVLLAAGTRRAAVRRPQTAFDEYTSMPSQRTMCGS